MAALAACGQRPVATPPAKVERIAIVATETGPQRARLVAIDERGDRQFDLLAPAAELERDLYPAISPDGKWIVFASTRDQTLDGTSLWIAALGVEAKPTRLTHSMIDTNPVWTPDGRAIVFASTRGAAIGRGFDFDLWRLAIRDGAAVGEPVQLTDGEGHEVAPSVAADGTIVYASVRRAGSHHDVRADDRTSRLEERAPDGAVRVLTEGPNDGSPAFSPDGATLVFSRSSAVTPVPTDELDGELWGMPRGVPADAVRIVALPLTDETGPSWSRDGRFLFATSVYRGHDRRVLFSSVVHVDLHETPRRVRILADRAGAISRLTPAIATSLDATALRGDPEYVPELARIMSAAIEKQEQEAQRR
jgi:Tol biopolymer transport system component